MGKQEMIWGSVFLAFVALDYGYARWAKSCSHDHAISAALWAVWIALMGGYISIQYIADNWALLPACAGAFVGTFIGVRYK